MTSFIYFITGFANYMLFAYDMENDRDFYTWMWLLFAIYWFVLSYEEYKENNKKKN